MKQTVKELMGAGADRSSTLIVNFEEPEFEGADVSLPQRIYEAYLEEALRKALRVSGRNPERRKMGTACKGPPPNS